MKKCLHKSSLLSLLLLSIGLGTNMPEVAAATEVGGPVAEWCEMATASRAGAASSTIAAENDARVNCVSALNIEAFSADCSANGGFAHIGTIYFYDLHFSQVGPTTYMATIKCEAVLCCMQNPPEELP